MSTKPPLVERTFQQLEWLRQSALMVIEQPTDLRNWEDIGGALMRWRRQIIAGAGDIIRNLWHDRAWRIFQRPLLDGIRHLDRHLSQRRSATIQTTMESRRNRSSRALGWDWQSANSLVLSEKDGSDLLNVEALVVRVDAIAASRSEEDKLDELRVIEADVSQARDVLQRQFERAENVASATQAELLRTQEKLAGIRQTKDSLDQDLLAARGSAEATAQASSFQQARRRSLTRDWRRAKDSVRAAEADVFRLQGRVKYLTRMMVRVTREIEETDEDDGSSEEEAEAHRVRRRQRQRDISKFQREQVMVEGDLERATSLLRCRKQELNEQNILYEDSIPRHTEVLDEVWQVEQQLREIEDSIHAGTMDARTLEEQRSELGRYLKACETLRVSLGMSSSTCLSMIQDMGRIPDEVVADESWDESLARLRDGLLDLKNPLATLCSSVKGEQSWQRQITDWWTSI
jgi:hypothetical protein